MNRASSAFRLCVYALIASAIAVVLFWKCKYGYATLDEAFYPTISYRFLQGDGILYDEWSNTQLSSVIIMPFVWIYTKITGSTDGIYLFFRYSYTVMKIVISLVLFKIISNRYGLRMAFIPALVFMIYSSYGMMVISYNSIAIAGFLLFLMLLLASDGKSWAKRIFAGIAISISVLGIPYMAVIYVLFGAVVVVINRKQGGDYRIKQFYSMQNLLGSAIGVTMSVGAFLIYTLRRTSLSQIIRTLPYIVYGDPAHAPKNLYQKTLAYFIRIAWGNERNVVVLGVYIILAIILFVFLCDKKKEERKYNYTFIITILCAALLVAYIITHNYINDIIFVPNVLAFLFFFSVKKR